VQDPGMREPPLRLQGAADRYDPRAEPGDGDDFSQAGDLYRLMSAWQKEQLIANLLAPLTTVPRHIQVRQTGHFFRADPDYGARIAAGLGIALEEIDGRSGQ
ncbi:catalase-related domain-containing protein, partial [Ideonella sp.]|uniref:catalase-related domain-containing protein n=1 Tax=Ideonella sp. TaxID=1929293 RepID=UPI003BB54949